jgi:hypothetical protein
MEGPARWNGFDERIATVTRGWALQSQICARIEKWGFTKLQRFSSAAD